MPAPFTTERTSTGSNSMSPGRSGAGGEDDVEIAVVDEGRWPDLEQLFQSRGGPKS